MKVVWETKTAFAIKGCQAGECSSGWDKLLKAVDVVI